MLCEELSSLSHCAGTFEHTEGAQLCALIEVKSRTRVSQVEAFPAASVDRIGCGVVLFSMHIVVGPATRGVCSCEGREHNFLLE